MTKRLTYEGNLYRQAFDTRAFDMLYYIGTLLYNKQVLHTQSFVFPGARRIAAGGDT